MWRGVAVLGFGAAWRWRWRRWDHRREAVGSELGGRWGVMFPFLSLFPFILEFNFLRVVSRQAACMTCPRLAPVIVKGLPKDPSEQCGRPAKTRQ